MGVIQISYDFILRFFKIFGLVPNKIDFPRMPMSRAYATTVVSALFFYWAVLLLSFWVPHGKTSNTISIISNWIQLLVNAITLTIALVYPVIASEIVPKIRDLFLHFDRKAEELGVGCNFQRISNIVGLVICALVMFNSYMLCYDLYVTYFLSAVSDLWYWLLTFLPLFVYSFAVCGALCVLLLLRFRFKTLNQLLAREVKGKAFTGKIDVLEVGDVKPRSKLTNIFYLMHDLYDLSKLIGQYYGPVFLTVFTAIFIVTTIQIYYIYTFFYSYDTGNEMLVWSILLCSNIVFLNIVMVFSITSVCESISNQSKRAIDTISKLKINGTVSCGPEEVQKIASAFNCTTSYVTFTASGFFAINYSMLCSMIGGITTYLIIYIQFYALYGKEGGETQASRNHDGATPIGSNTNEGNGPEVQKITNAFHCATNHIAFSANGFFNINYSMLCSMIGGITTYLIIYIQFYSVFGNKPDELEDNLEKANADITRFTKST
ncbi:gustatory and pheromone receptor 32a-like [Culicoides brevitarsis]|uniref:gustatory and pheromone receptor 32a-like n=1 Tax=Culicoides brevitarsis TaxID=469753 RepID=UPI00307C13B7